ncbi:MAG: HAMP domain-containing protein, partial [Acidobacteriota bacterium]
MRSLYFKIFLWFWLAMAGVGIAFVISTATLQSTEAESRWRAFVASGLTLSGQAAIDAYRTGGTERLADYFERMERRNDIRAYLYDQQLTELSGRQAPPAGPELARQALDTDELVVQEYEDSRLVALSLGPSEGSDYVLLADIDWPFRGGARRDRFDSGRRRAADVPPTPAPGESAGGSAAGGPAGEEAGRGGGFRRGGPREPLPWYGVWLSAIDQPGALALRMAAILLTAGALCYGLARYLTAPVFRLRDATHRLAGGDLSVRVGPAVAKRGDEIAELGRDFDLMAERIESLLTAQRQLLSDV